MLGLSTRTSQEKHPNLAIAKESESRSAREGPPVCSNLPGVSERRKPVGSDAAAAVDFDAGAGDELGFVGRQPQRGIGDIEGPGELPEEDGSHELRADLGSSRV